MDHALIKRYKEAFAKANPEHADAIKVTYERGWYYVSWDEWMFPLKRRRQQLEEAAERLERRSAEVG